MMGVICRKTGKAIAAKLDGHYCLCKTFDDCPVTMNHRPRDREFTGQALWDLIVAIEGAIGARKAGLTPLGKAVGELCETAWKNDPIKKGN